MTVNKESTEKIMMALRQIVMEIAALKPSMETLLKEIKDYQRLDIIVYHMISINEKNELDTTISIIKPVMDKAIELLEAYEESAKNHVEKVLKI